jgi:hypothetical protein
MEWCSLCRCRFAPVEPIKKPQPEARGESASSEQRRCCLARRWTRGAVTSGGTDRFSISNFVPDGWRENIRFESMPNCNLRKNTAAIIAANFVITTDKVRSYCAMQ